MVQSSSAGSGTSHVLLYCYAITGIVGIRILLSRTFEAWNLN